MQATRKSLSTELAQEEPVSEHTAIQRIVQRQTVPVETLEYHLFRPRKAHDPLLESAYDVWREGWRATLLELEGTTELHSDDFSRQDEIGVIASGGQCVAVTGIRWLDLSLPRSLEDSYFKTWPGPAVAAVAQRFVSVASNTVVHPDWRGTLIDAPRGQEGDPTRLAFATVALSVRRFVASSADLLIALTRNDRSIDRFAQALGATRLALIQVHGIDTDVICIERPNATPEGPVMNELWRRRHQG
ncbi:MAG TPA: hypothetical protein VJU61_08665 [Polyangiaceae bacterium]|nr:hypothetical protein [Polyangiaceae bacterium]